MAEQSIDVVRGVYEALARGDVPTALGAMADDVEWHEAEGMPYGGVYRGGEAVVENVLGPITRDVSDFAVSVEEMIGSGEKVATVVRYTGTGADSGKGLDLSVVHVWDVRAGKIVRFRQFIDTVKFRQVVPH